MIIVQLKGGLGNQLFQYAAGLSLAKHSNVKLKVDTTLLQRPDEEIGTSRNYELDKIKVPPAVASRFEIAEITDQSFLTKYFQKALPCYKRSIYNEASFRFDTNFFKAKPPLYLKGYRQSEKYFFPIRDTIKEELALSETLISNVLPFSKILAEQESVSLHIRRGDYLQKDVKNYHGILEKEYYQKAIDLIKTQVKNPVFYVFSDNPDWVKQNVYFHADTVFVSGNHSSTSYEDLYLMSCCKHNIIANSSFSWWAAWFNNYPQKNIIAPAKWFNNKLDTKDLTPQQWTKI